MDVVQKLREVIETSPLGHLLQPVLLNPEIKAEAMMAYLHDFLHMVYKPTVDGEMEVNFTEKTCINYHAS